MARFGEDGREEVLCGNDEKLRGEETHQLRRPEVPRAEEHSLDENFGVGDDWNGKNREFKRGSHLERFIRRISNYAFCVEINHWCAFTDPIISLLQ